MTRLTERPHILMSTQDDNESIHSTFSDGDGLYSISLLKLELAVREILGVQQGGSGIRMPDRGPVGWLPLEP